MALNLSLPEQQDLKPRITVFGVGGAGGNAVNNMIEKELDGAEFVVANTDAQALAQSRSKKKIQMGTKVTEGLGAGARPSVGAAAAEETIEEIVDHLAGSHMCFITAGMGGGTGTGAAPIIAQAARELGVLTVGVVTKPFQFEGAKRMRQAEEGVAALQKVVDTLIIIPNQNLFRLANEKTTFTEAFAMADDVLYQGVKGITDLMVRPGLINLDFADVRAVMDEMGKAMMGTGEASGEDRAVQAAEKAIANPLLDEISLKGARGVLINITGGHDLTLFELDEAANRIREEVDPDANIIVGSTLDTSLDGMMRVSVVATGIDAATMHQDVPVARTGLSHTARPAEPRHAAPAVAEDAHAAPSARAAPAPAPAAAEQDSLFADFDETEEDDGFIEEDDAEFASIFGDEPMTDEDTDDGLPPPVYAPDRQHDTMAANRDAGGFVAPKARAPGVPSTETMERLRTAVKNAPKSGAQPALAAPGPALRRPAAPAAPAARPAAPAPEKPSRFGINNLINRMTGHSAEDRAAPPAPAEEADAHDPEQARIDIPAFLRRQAN